MYRTTTLSTVLGAITLFFLLSSSRAAAALLLPEQTLVGLEEFPFPASPNTVQVLSASIDLPNEEGMGGNVRIHQNDADNSFGGLTFVYRFQAYANRTSPIVNVRIPGFAGLDLDLGWVDGFGDEVVPASAERSNDGGTIDFDFFELDGHLNTGELGAGGSSADLSFRTNGQGWRSAELQLTDAAGNNFNLSTLVPRLVPEPSSIALFTVAVGAFAVARRRK